MERNRSLDIGKGIAIILVVLGHTYSFSEGNVILNWIEAFHMPFFFVVSGILYGGRSSKVQDFSLKFGNKVKTMLVPYFAWEIPFLLYLFLAKQLADGLTIDYAVRKSIAVMNLSGLHSTWFLPSLLGVQILFAALTRMGKLPCIIGAVCLVVIGLLYPNPENYLPVVIRCFVALGFFSAGFFGSKWWRRERNPIIAVLAAIGYCLLANYNGFVNLVSCTFSNPLLYVVNALLGIFALLQLSMRLCNVGKIGVALEYLGRNSIIVLCTHAFIIEFVRLVDYKVLHNVLPRLGYFEGLLFTALIIIAEIPVMIFGRRFFPVLFGLKKKDS